MKSKHSQTIKTLCLSAIATTAASLLFSFNALAAETTQLKSKGPHFGEDGWDVALGVGAVTWNAPFYIGEDDSGAAVIPLLDVTYQKDRFYFAANDTDGLIAGYTLYRTDNWVLDAGFAPGITGIDFSDNNELKHLQERDIDGLLGFRISHYGEHDRLSLSIGKDVLGAHDGFAADASYYYEWQLKNWLFTGSTGISYTSEEMTNHIVGVSANEATLATPAYQADAGYAAQFALKAEYPVNENWVFTGKVGQQLLSDEFKNSPITRSDSDGNSFALIGMKYQF